MSVDARLIAPRGGNDRVLRHVVLGGESVEYRLVRVRRRSIGMVISHEGLCVRAPRWVGVREIEAALADRSEWIVTTLREWRTRAIGSLPERWRSGASLLLRGQPLELSVLPARRKSISADLISLTVLHPTPSHEEAIAAFVIQWMKEQALAQLSARVSHFAGRLACSRPLVKLSNARTQWGSCNHRGHIRLHWRLVQLPVRVADYVVAHEVAHLVELNHSPHFWRVVEGLFPDHAAARRELDALTPILA